jgi:hypothetical protein
MPNGPDPGDASSDGARRLPPAVGTGPVPGSMLVRTSEGDIIRSSPLAAILLRSALQPIAAELNDSSLVP